MIIPISQYYFHFHFTLFNATIDTEYKFLLTFNISDLSDDLREGITWRSLITAISFYVNNILYCCDPGLLKKARALTIHYLSISTDNSA